MVNPETKHAVEVRSVLDGKQSLVSYMKSAVSLYLSQLTRKFGLFLLSLREMQVSMSRSYKMT